MRDIAITVIVFGVLLVVLRHPHYGIYLWSWLSYMNPHKQAWGFAYDFPFAQITAIVTILAYFLSRETKRIAWTPEIAILVLFNLWMVITTVFSFFPDLAWAQWDKVWKIQLMTLLTLMLITNAKRLNGFVWVITLSIGYYGVKGGIFTIATGGSYRVWGPDGTFIAGNNEIALALIMIIPLIRYLHLQETRRWIRYALAAAMVLCAVSAIGSQSRGALLSILAMGGYLWLKSRNKLITGIYALIAVMLIAMVMPAEWYERMNTIQNYQEDGSAMGRINAWHVAFNVAMERITGGGFEMFLPAVFSQYAPDPLDVHDAHSIYFEVLGEHGWIGLILWVSVGLLAWLRAGRIIRAGKRDPDLKWAADLAGMVQVSMIGYAAGGAFLGLAYFDLYYHLIVMVLVAFDVAIRSGQLASASGRQILGESLSHSLNR
ncbi:MAG: putative O-glycosylation ligase, exosortase A system-associated [Hydrogenophilaceae bacterium]|nr:putative O-glycosylation ligase, exosortase A system-associated [Hydrogenophilaceae bacterium]